VVGATVHGAVTHRWAALAPAADRTQRMHDLAVVFADYTSEAIPTDFEVKEKSAVTCRRCVSEAIGVGAMTSITTGPPGAVATHTPDVCYPSSGYQTVSPVRKETVALPGGASATYYVADFEKKSATRTDRQRVRWAWAVPGGSWDAPNRPRFAYIGSPELFKLYVVTQYPTTDGDEKPADDTPAVKAFVAAAWAAYADAAAR
ncbi:MAG: hypothetical protein ACRC7O_18240, partial [Fimbriiglobus sp.]